MVGLFVFWAEGFFLKRIEIPMFSGIFEIPASTILHEITATNSDSAPSCF